MPSQTTGRLPEEDVNAVVEFQAIELERLLRDNQRLNKRIDYLIEEVGGLRRLQSREHALREREQDLRERDHALHQETQNSLVGFMEKAILPRTKDAGSRALADIHRTPPDRMALSDRYTNIEAQRQPEKTWPDIPAFLRRS